jgi:hypothetical protein
VTVRIQLLRVPIAYLETPNAKPVALYATDEWRRPLEELARLVNLYETQIAALEARLTAGGL